jgi:hypothetical protein
MVVEDVRADVDEMRREGADRDGVVWLIDHEHLEPGALELSDGAAGR